MKGKHAFRPRIYKTFWRAKINGSLSKKIFANGLWELLVRKSWKGQRKKKDIDSQIKNERASWDK